MILISFFIENRLKSVEIYLQKRLTVLRHTYHYLTKILHNKVTTYCNFIRNISDLITAIFKKNFISISLLAVLIVMGDLKIIGDVK